MVSREPLIRPADNSKPLKKKTIERIDGFVALIMAIEQATTQPGTWNFKPSSLLL